MRRGDVVEVDEPIPNAWEIAAATVRDTLEARGQKAAQVKLRRTMFRPWTDGVPEPRGPLNFRDFAFQAELYDQRSADDDEQVYKKATQVGVSTQSVRWALFHADVHQRVGIYTFPTTNELGKFSRQRIKPVIRGSAHLRSRMSGDAVDNVEQKQIGERGWIYFVGMNKPIDSIDGDFMVFDEYDTSDQENIEASERRLSGLQSAGLIRRVGVPSIPGFGIDALYDASDRRVWHVKCEVCNHWNPINGIEAFEQNVDQENLQLVCAKCRSAIDVRDGEWVAEYPDREVRGYHIPKLLIPGRKTIAKVVNNSRKTKPYEIEAFHQRDLGEAYAPAEGRLSLEAIQACVRPDLRLEESLAHHGLVTMGVDMASARALNVTIEAQIDPNDPNSAGRKVFVGEVGNRDPERTFQQLCVLMETYGVNMCCIDNSPDGRFSEALKQRYPGRVFSVSFFTPQAQGRKVPEPWTVDYDARHVSLWRTKAYDATLERYRMQKVLLPPLETLPWDRTKNRSDFAAQLGNIYRRRVEKDDGTERVEYVKTGPEDYAQAEAYNLAAIELFWNVAGTTAARGQGPTPLVDEIEDFVPADLAGYGDDTYRGGFGV